MICLVHGGPIATSADAACVNERAGVVGFVGVSSLERLAFEQSLPELTWRFKNIPVGRPTEPR